MWSTRAQICARSKFLTVGTIWAPLYHTMFITRIMNRLISENNIVICVCDEAVVVQRLCAIGYLQQIRHELIPKFALPANDWSRTGIAGA